MNGDELVDIAKQYFLDTCAKIEIKLDELPHIPNVEPDMVEMLTFINKNPTLRPMFVRLFINIVQMKIRAPVDVLEFCMRELQYPEVRVELEKQIEKRDPRTYYIWKDVLEVYKADWSNPQGYTYYGDYGD